MSAACEGAPSFSIVADPKGDDRLRDFSTGTSETWESDVNDLVEELFTEGSRGYSDLKTLVMTDESGDTTLGVSAWFPRPLEETEWIRGDPLVIHAIGISEPFRRTSRDEDSPHLGSLLLKQTLRTIRGRATKQMRAVWANITPGNEEAQTLFYRRHFSELGPERWLRGEDKPIR